jgi:hypothetical protein
MFKIICLCFISLNVFSLEINACERCERAEKFVNTSIFLSKHMLSLYEPTPMDPRSYAQGMLDAQKQFKDVMDLYNKKYPD